VLPAWRSVIATKPAAAGLYGAIHSAQGPVTAMISGPNAPNGYRRQNSSGRHDAPGRDDAGLAPRTDQPGAEWNMPRQY